MPRTTKKTVKKTKVTRREQAEQRADTIKAKIASMNLSRSYTSLAYGVITVLVIFALIFAAVRVFTQDNTPNISEDAVNTMSDESNQTNVHVVQEGETLWSISEKVYNDGFAWKEIADANSISEASTLEEGTELIIPAREAQAQEISMTDGEDAAAEPTMSQMQEQPEVSPSTTQESITGSAYTVKAGDTLWDISMRTYGTGYRWTEIASSNSISDPNIIFTGTNLQLPAK